MLKRIFSVILIFNVASALWAGNIDSLYSRHLAEYVSKPKVGGYFIGQYDYSSQEGRHEGDGFKQRLIRVYVDGTILDDFAYRVQVQLNNQSFHMKDYYVEWKKVPEARLRIGQFKRAFTLENPMNPWDVGTGDYSQAVKKLAGMGDYCGETAASGGRDQGLQVQGDLLPSRKDGHPYFHYQVAVYNGQGINCSDRNSRKDVMATLQVNPIKGLTVGVFGWTGDYVGDFTTPAGISKAITVSRNRYALSAAYNRNDWTFRTEYVHSKGHKVSDYDGDESFKGTGRADAWYATLGIPFTPWLKTYIKYDAYRDQATWNTMKSIYSVAPNIQPHRNLMLQLQYNFVNDRNLTGKQNYHELWAQAYVRF